MQRVPRPYLPNVTSSSGKIINLWFDGIDGDTLMLALAAHGMYVSTGSACRSNEKEPSRVLLATGLSSDEARKSIRISLSDTSTFEDAYRGAAILAETVKNLLG